MTAASPSAARATGVTALAPAGELTVQTAAERRTELLAGLSPDHGVEVDLSGVTEMDTAGLQLLLVLKRSTRRLGQQAVFTAPSPAVQEVLAVARLDLQLEPVAPADLAGRS